jgi:hypothetical protein
MSSSSTTVTNHGAKEVNPQYDIPPSVFTLRRTAQLEALYTIIRDKDTPRGDFIFYSDRIIRLLVEEGLNQLPVLPKIVETPTVRALLGRSLTFFRPIQNTETAYAGRQLRRCRLRGKDLRRVHFARGGGARACLALFTF